MRIVFYLWLLFFSACVGMRENPDLRVRGALDILAETIGPVSKFAHDGCLTAEQAAVDEAAAGRQTVEKAQDKILLIRAHCAELRRVFDELRIAHAQARALVDDGRFDEAQAHIEEIKRLFHSLGETP